MHGANLAADVAGAAENALRGVAHECPGDRRRLHGLLSKVDGDLARSARVPGDVDGADTDLPSSDEIERTEVEVLAKAAPERHGHAGKARCVGLKVPWVEVGQRGLLVVG
jgi:hypothetical protein